MSGGGTVCPLKTSASESERSVECGSDLPGWLPPQGCLDKKETHAVQNTSMDRDRAGQRHTRRQTMCAREDHAVFATPASSKMVALCRGIPSGLGIVCVLSLRFLLRLPQTVLAIGFLLLLWLTGPNMVVSHDDTGCRLHGSRTALNQVSHRTATSANVIVQTTWSNSTTSSGTSSTR